MSTPEKLERVYREFLESLRRWGIQATLAIYSSAEWDDIDAATLIVGPLVSQAYAAAAVSSLDATDQYMGLVAATKGKEYVADWTKGRSDWPLLLSNGTPVAQWMSYAGAGVKKLIAGGVPLESAVETSQARAAQAVATGPLHMARTTTWNRFLVDSLIGERDISPEMLRPWTDEVEVYANLWDGRSRREYSPTWQRWRRVPSPGACGFCLMLATKTNYTSADAAMYAGGAEGTTRREFRRGREDMLAGVSRRTRGKMEAGDRFHNSCRCTVQMTTSGSPAAISREDFERLSTPKADGTLPTFGKGKYRYDVNQFKWDVGAVGVPLPPTAPWAQAWKNADYIKPPRERIPSVLV